MQKGLKLALATVVTGVAFAGAGVVHLATAATTAQTGTPTPVARPAKPAKAAKPARPVASTPASPSATSAAHVEQLKAMVPARIGRWKRVAAPARADVPEDPSAPGVQAEFAAGREHIALEVSKVASVAAEPTDLPRITRNGAGHELVYRDGRELVVERVRHSDGQAQVTLRRDDGLTVVAEGTGIAPERLKAVARAVGRRG